MQKATFLLFALAWTFPASAQQTVKIRVNASGSIGALPPSWNYFGYDEANYTTTENGRKLIGELSALGNTPTHIRTHFLLVTGDGTGALKFGSTNAYTEDAAGRPMYDWTEVDKIIGTFVEHGAVPLVEIGFMPKALSSRPAPYEPHWQPGDKFDQYYLGWTYPPANYDKWATLVGEWVQHTAEKFGTEQVSRWDWEVWNEPNIGYWHGTPAEYDKLYDYTANAVKRVLPGARVGGPASTGPADEGAAAFLTQFLEHCASGKNAATGRIGAPLDFISFHVKGRPRVVDGHVQMGLMQELKDASRGFDIVHSTTQFQKLPIILSEADPEGCAACSARVYSPNAYRNGTLYPAYTATAYRALLDLAQQHEVNLKGMLTWAFEFEGQPSFAGFRSLATNGVDKPILNFFRMAGLLDTERVRVDSTHAVETPAVLTRGVPDSDVDALATRGPRRLAVLIWNYRDSDVPASTVNVSLQLSGIPSEAHRLLIRHYRIDATHSNAYTAWQVMGSPEHPSTKQSQLLEEAGQLQMLLSPFWIRRTSGTTSIPFTLPGQALSLVEVSW